MHILQAAVPQVVERRDVLAVTADVAIIVTGVAVIVLAVLLVGIIRESRSMLREFRIGVRQNLGPVSDRARSVADNVEFITDTLRADVRQLTASVRILRERLEQASDHMEDRIEEFNALLETVQSEAEDLFLDTAAGVHGIREGARSITRSRSESEGSRDVAPGRESPGIVTTGFEGRAPGLEGGAPPTTPERDEG